MLNFLAVDDLSPRPRAGHSRPPPMLDPVEAVRAVQLEQLLAALYRAGGGPSIPQAPHGGVFGAVCDVDASGC